MSCKNCYDGCGTPVPDSCVKYTGQDIPLFGICTGDTISKVEQSIITKLGSVLDGTGIDLSSITLDCDFIVDLLGNEDQNLANIIQVLIQANCTLSQLVNDINLQVNGLYTFNTVCLSGLNASSSRDDILQATINKVCSLAASVNNVNSDYVKATDLNSLIAQYLQTIPISTQQNTKMVPYVAYEYYGPLSNFDTSGKGLSSAGFDKVFLCNGSNGTPDKRGRVAVGAIQSVPGGALDSDVDPSLPANAGTNYVLNQKFGQSFVGLTTNQLPAHTHPITDPGHKHSVTYGADKASGNNNGGYQTYNTDGLSKNTLSATTGITIGNTGSNQTHENRQPSIAAYFIMYVPQ